MSGVIFRVPFEWVPFGGSGSESIFNVAGAHFAGDGTLSRYPPGPPDLDAGKALAVARFNDLVDDDAAPERDAEPCA